MSTRCMIRFGYKNTKTGKLVTEAMVYQHGDGYPTGQNGVPANLQKFFEAVERSTNDTRFCSPEHLAARFVVWSVNEMRERMKSWDWHKAEAKDGPLNFLSIGVSQREHGDIAYSYFVDCSPPCDYNSPARPRVLWRERGSKKNRVASPKLYAPKPEKKAQVSP